MTGSREDVLALARALGGPDLAAEPGPPEPAVRLLRKLAHQLRSPLTAVVGFSAVLAAPAPAERAEAGRPDEPDGPGRRHAAAREVVAAAHRVQLVLDTVVTWASPWPVVRLEPVALPVAVAEALGDLAPPGADPVSVGAVPEVTVRADKALLRQLLRQVLDNACLHAVPGRQPTVRVSAGGTADRWWVQVTDDGSGVPPEDRCRVVRPYVRLDRDRPGAGLGLAVADRAAAAHRGRLTVSATAGGGTAVTVDAAPGGWDERPRRR